MEAKGGAGGGIRGEGESEWLSSGKGRQENEEKSGAVERRNIKEEKGKWKTKGRKGR